MGSNYYGRDYYLQSPEKDPTGPASGSFHVLRGGDVMDSPDFMRSATRSKHDGDSGGSSGYYFTRGFRVVREVD